jgi:hypothetical protein
MDGGVSALHQRTYAPYRDLTDEQWNIVDPLRRAAGGDVGTTAGESSTAILGSHGGNDFQAEKWETSAHGRRRRSVSTTVQKEWSNKPGRS